MQVFYSHVSAILFRETPDPARLRDCLSGLTHCGRSSRDGKPEEFNALQGDGFSVIWNPTTGETAEIDLQASPWPDDHGADSGDGPTIVAGHIGALGPGAGAGGLGRACQQAWFWKDAAGAVARHTGFVAIRICGAMLNHGAELSSAPEAKLKWMLETAVTIAQLPGAIAYFNPVAEVVRPPDQLMAVIDPGQPEHHPALEALLGMRRWIIDGWDLFDVAGMQQFGLPDMEFATPQGSLNSSECYLCFANLCLHLIGKGDVIATGHTVDGPRGRRWRAMKCAHSAALPGRPVIRWSEENGKIPPPSLTPAEAVMGAGQDPETEALAQGIGELASHIQHWQQRVALHRPHIDRYLATEDAFALAGLGAETLTDQGIKRAMAGGRIIPVFPVIGSTDPSLPLRPTLTVGTFSEDIHVILRATVLAARMGELYHSGKAKDPVDRLLQKIVQDDKYVAKKRVRLPASAAGEYEIYAFNTLVRRDDRGEAYAGILAAYTPPGAKPAMIMHLHSALMEGATPPAAIVEDQPPSPPGTPPPLPGSSVAKAQTPPAPPLSFLGRIWQGIKYFFMIIWLLAILFGIIQYGISLFQGGDKSPTLQKSPSSPRSGTR